MVRAAAAGSLSAIYLAMALMPCPLPGAAGQAGSAPAIRGQTAHAHSAGDPSGRGGSDSPHAHAAAHGRHSDPRAHHPGIDRRRDGDVVATATPDDAIPALTAPCACGCGERSGGEGPGGRLGLFLPSTAEAPKLSALPLVPGLSSQRICAGRVRLPDHVPIAI